MDINKFTTSLFEICPNNIIQLKNNIFGFIKILETYLSTNGINKLNTTNKIFNSFIDDTAYIGDYTLIRNSIIGENCKIGTHVEINNCIIMSGTVIPHHNYIGYSLLGNNVNIGGNVRTAVRRLDDKNIKIHFDKNKSYSTERIKFGSIIGDNCKIGSNVILNSGTIIGKNLKFEPGLIVRGFFEKNSYLRNKNII